MRDSHVSLTLHVAPASTDCHEEITLVGNNNTSGLHCSILFTHIDLIEYLFELERFIELRVVLFHFDLHHGSPCLILIASAALRFFICRSLRFVYRLLSGVNTPREKLLTAGV